jgi:hypothetical protein
MEEKVYFAVLQVSKDGEHVKIDYVLNETYSKAEARIEELKGVPDGDLYNFYIDAVAAPQPKE